MGLLTLGGTFGPVGRHLASSAGEGECRTLSDDVMFGDRWQVEAFDPPEYPAVVRYRYGADWGFANDPTTLIRAWIIGKAPYEELWIDQEAYKVGCEIDDTPALFDEVPGALHWPIHGDSARPETIS